MQHYIRGGRDGLELRETGFLTGGFGWTQGALIVLNLFSVRAEAELYTIDYLYINF